MHLIIIQRKKKEKISKIPEKTIKKLEIEYKRKREKQWRRRKKKERKSRRDINILKKLTQEEQIIYFLSKPVDDNSFNCHDNRQLFF